MITLTKTYSGYVMRLGYATANILTNEPFATRYAAASLILCCYPRTFRVNMFLQVYKLLPANIEFPYDATNIITMLELLR